MSHRGEQTILPAVYGGTLKIKLNVETVKSLFFSDNCAGQNKNKAIVGMYLHAMNTFNIDSICHYYLEPGHTQNEGDSMHALIERSARRVNVYTPMQWYVLAQSVKKTGQPYIVQEMAGYMKDFKSLGEVYCRNLKGAVSLKSPEWQRVKALRIEKESPHVLFLKYSCNTAPFIPYIGRLEEPERNILGPEPIGNMSTVSKAKKDDLLYMCRQLIIPRDHHLFYENLPVENSHNEVNENEVHPETRTKSVKKSRKRTKK